VFGELYPKQIALQMPESIARHTAGPIVVVKTLFKPFVWLLSFSTGILKKLTPIEFTNVEEKLTRDEMKAILAQSRGEGVIDPSEFTMMQGVLSLDTKLARELMVPRTDTLMMDLDDDLEYNIELVLNSQYSRIPVYEEDKDNVIGVLHMKNVLKASKEVGFERISFRELVNTPLFVPSTIYVDDLLVEFRKTHTHMAIIKDEYGGVEGIITLEDLLEEIVGDIEDEYDEIYRLSKKIDDNHYVVNGRMPLDKFNQLFKTAIASEEVDTIAGYMIEELGYFPKDDEHATIQTGEYLLTTTQVESGRIRGIRVTREPVQTVVVDDE
jgi:putative hemolysin